MKITITLSILMMLVSECLLAQDTRLAGIEYFVYPKASIKEGSGSYESSFMEFGAFAAYPVQSKNKKTRIVNSIQYTLVDASVYDDVTSVTNSRNFYSIEYSFLIIQELSSKWKITAMITPTLASDFKDNLSSDDFITQGSIVAIRKLSPYCSTGLGVTYTTKLGFPSLLPVLYFRYNKNRNKLNILLPTLIDYAYSIDRKDRLNAGFRAGLNGANFHISGNNIDSSIDINQLRYSRLNLGPVISYKISKMIKLEVNVGLSTARKYEFVTTQDNKYNFNSNSVVFFNVGLAIVPPLFKEN